jgi:hypothetical protein
MAHRRPLRLVIRGSPFSGAPCVEVPQTRHRLRADGTVWGAATIQLFIDGCRSCPSKNVSVRRALLDVCKNSAKLKFSAAFRDLAERARRCNVADENRTYTGAVQ